LERSASRHTASEAWSGQNQV